MKIKLIKEVGNHSVGTILEINDGYGRQLIEQGVAEGLVKDPVTTKEVKEVPQTKEKK